MNTARLNQGTPLLLSGVTKRYGDNTVLNGLDLHIPAGQFVAVVGAAAAARVRCYGCWPDWKPQRRRHSGRNDAAFEYSG